MAISFYPTSGSTIEPNNVFVITWSTITSADELRLYATTSRGEETIIDWAAPSPVSEMARDDGGFTVLVSSNVVLAVICHSGWDDQDGTMTLRVESVDNGTPSTDVATYTIDPVIVATPKLIYAAEGLERMLDQFDGSVNLRLLASSYLDQVQALEKTAYSLINARWLGVAAGDRLDGLGQIAGVSRSGREDRSYLLRIRGELATLTSQGSIEDLIVITQLLLKFATPDDIEITEYFPKMLVIRPVDHILTEDAAVIGAQLKRAVSAATQLWFLYSEQLDAATFTLSSQAATLETSNLLGLSNDTQTSGGHLANVV